MLDKIMYSELFCTSIQIFIIFVKALYWTQFSCSKLSRKISWNGLFINRSIRLFLKLLHNYLFQNLNSKNVIIEKSWKFCFNSTSISKVTELSFSTKLLLFSAQTYFALFSQKHVFSIMLICYRIRESCCQEVWYIIYL